MDVKSLYFSKSTAVGCLLDHYEVNIGIPRVNDMSLSSPIHMILID